MKHYADKNTTIVIMSLAEICNLLRAAISEDEELLPKDRDTQPVISLSVTSTKHFGTHQLVFKLQPSPH